MTIYAYFKYLNAETRRIASFQTVCIVNYGRNKV